MSMTLNLTEDKMKAGTKRMLAELKLAGADVSRIGYNKALHIFSKALLDKPYEEVKGAIFDTPNDSTANAYSVFLLRCGSNTILAVNGVYQTATNPGTDLEIPYHAIEAQAQAEASKLGVPLKEVTLPEILEAPETDDEWVELARQMGYFKPEGSIFERFGADLIFIEGRQSPYTVDSEWQTVLEGAVNEGNDPDNEIIWDTEVMEFGDKFEFCFTFGDLKKAVYKGEGEWVIPNKEYFRSGEPMSAARAITIGFFNKQPAA